MATNKKSSVKNISAGPSKKTKIAPKVDPKGAYTKVQQRTLGNMKSGGKMKKGKTC
jgi:multidrug resistance efflux pump